MADAGVPKTGDVIHARDLKEAVCNISSLITGGVRYCSYNTYAGSSENIFCSVNSMDAGDDTVLVEKKALKDALGNHYTKSQLDTRFKQSYTEILPFSARNNGTYTFSQSIDNFDAVEVLCSGYSGTEQFSYIVIRKEDYYISNSAGANFAIYYSIGGATRRVMFSLTTTSIACTSNEGPARLCRVRGIVY